jgi:hypothetical protein
MILKQTRECDGSCCRAHPRFPNVKGDDCIYHLNLNGKESSGCELMIDPSKMPDDKSVIYPELTSSEVFKKTCLDWPHNMADRGTGDCCWQWIDDGN